ncbi:MAG: YbaB/EbfC family nucleoid-associated protein [Cystobacterineae bacterium]|nr:YbaB/EbfC family nucleoid-associated protein [Cystobacterineae bacterium]
MPGLDLNYFVRQANKMTEKIEQRKEELAQETVEGKSGDNLVVVLANGIQEIKSIQISPEALALNDTGMLEDLLVAAVNSALNASRTHMQAELGKLTGGMKIPGLM